MSYTSRILLIFLLLLVVTTLSSAFRVNKASRKSLDRIKRLINTQTEREHARLPEAMLDDAAFVQRKDPASKAQHNELTVNNLDDYFQGDMDLSEKQAEMISAVLEDVLDSSAKEKDPEAKARSKRKVGREPLYVRWTFGKPISYEFADSIPEPTRHKVRAAIASWEQRTCVRFQENGPSVDRIEFFDGGGCSSFVGKTGGTQGISIATPGCDLVGIIAHEIGHALGVFHEQARPDQSKHILVNYNNIPIGRWNNFHPVSYSQADTYNLPYDTGSVMHYGAYGFATDTSVPTITTRSRLHQYTIGQRQGPSFLDIAAINVAYRCMQRCPYIKCEHDGYPNPNQCSECLCPDGFAGSTCQFVHYTPCGALISASRDAVWISSPNYPNWFEHGTECIWLLRSKPGSTVMLQFEDTFHMQCDDTCDKTFVELKTAEDFRITGYRFCCSKKPTQVFTSVTNEMVVIFRALGHAGQGFKAKVWSDADPITTVMPSTSKIPTTTTTEQLSTTREASTTRPSPRTEIITSTVWTSQLTTPKPKSYKSFTTTSSLMRHTTTTNRQTMTTSSLVSQTGATTHMPVIEQGSRPDVCVCAPWAEWTSDCSQQCGGCGRRSRTRQCASDQCRTQDRRACNFHTCPPGTNFLINNGEFHILWRGCCVGLFRSNEECSALDEGQNPLLTILSSLLSSQDARNNTTTPHA